MKILYYGENPANPTGFGNMSKQILSYLAQAGYEIEVVATSVFAEQLPGQYPYSIIPCPLEPEPDMRNLANIRARLVDGDCDVFFYMGDFGANDDVFLMLGEARAKRPELLSIAYCPLDCDMLNAVSFGYMAVVNVPTVYTLHAARRIAEYRPDLAGKLTVIWPGCEPDVFYPLLAEERFKARKEIFGIEDDTFIAVNVNRNQIRKDLGRCMAIWHEFYKTHPHSLLYMHSVKNDLGGNLPLMADSLGIGPDEILFTPDSFSLGNPATREELNRVYNAADLRFSTTTGEGWGLPTTEAMAAGCPVLVPGNTANLDIVGEDEERGTLIKTGGDIDHMIWTYGGAANPRDIVHSADCLRRLEFVYSNRSIIYAKAMRARKWAELHTWDVQGAKWQSLMAALDAFRKARNNEPVPVGS